MNRTTFAASVLALASLPLWCTNPYILSVVSAAGIFVIAAISLNLLLGYTGLLLTPWLAQRFRLAPLPAKPARRVRA